MIMQDGQFHVDHQPVADWLRQESSRGFPVDVPPLLPAVEEKVEKYINK